VSFLVAHFAFLSRPGAWLPRNHEAGRPLHYVHNNAL
jgi:hypothetical protein